MCNVINTLSNSTHVTPIPCRQRCPPRPPRSARHTSHSYSVKFSFHEEFSSYMTKTLHERPRKTGGARAVNSIQAPGETRPRQRSQSRRWRPGQDVRPWPWWDGGNCSCSWSRHEGRRRWTTGTSHWRWRDAGSCGRPGQRERTGHGHWLTGGRQAPGGRPWATGRQRAAARGRAFRGRRGRRGRRQWMASATRRAAAQAREAAWMLRAMSRLTAPRSPGQLSPCCAYHLRFHREASRPAFVARSGGEPPAAHYE
jgi:hypothetical protein